MIPSIIKGQRINQFVAPTAFIMLISSRRENIVILIVFAIINNDSVKEILNILKDLDALSLYSMDFGIVNKKEELKFSIFLHSEFLDTLTEAIECKTIKNIPINQETYWSIFDKSKSYRITSRSNNNE